ncbi:hypothetical protein KKB55_16440 [Myxococcota bacterium]|nr:hypothetical protein [Myxococcota bacterium]MBU1899331.1 hypothetical protein [Myxococcota bacterium]
MKVEFRVLLIEDHDLIELNEAEIAAEPAAFRARLNADEVLDGALWIANDDQPPAEIVDELWQLVQVLCFEGAYALTGDTPTPLHYRYLSSGFELSLTPMGACVFLEGGDVPRLILNRAELVAALYDCGARFLSLLRALGAPRAALLSALMPFAERCARQLLFG